ncbi:hypothetical protein OSB04_un000514 [Centaurea solstitialis]|uniref:Uncharacterized protein n=1 Tax=Centaurea solstitialis TaxID=347529 RepID=A0AA38SHJ1_9ASTR|nr:hypothetical protein OSB04_un000514 [Centaurea solstitialis]
MKHLLTNHRNGSMAPFGVYKYVTYVHFSICEFSEIKLYFGYCITIQHMCAPKLCNLTITDNFAFPKVFNVVAPQLKNLTASVVDELSNFLQLSFEDLDSLEKVNLSMQRTHRKEQTYAPVLLDLFQKLSCVKLLILDERIIKVLSARLDLLSVEPCSFNNLKCLKQKDGTYEMLTQVRNYFLESSPNVTFIMDLPPVPHKRLRQEAENDTMSNTLDNEKQQTKTVDEEKRMLEAKIFKQDQLIAKKKAMLEAMEVQCEKRMLEAMEVQCEKRMLEAKIQVQDKVIAQQNLLHENAMLEEKLQMQDKVIEEQKAMLETLKLQNEKKVLETLKLQNEKKMFEEKLLGQDKIIAQQKAMLDAMKLQHEKIETELGNIDSCLDVPTVAVPTLPS